MRRNLRRKLLGFSIVGLCLASGPCMRTGHAQLRGDGTPTPPELAAVQGGMQTLVPYVNAGGRFIGQKNAYGQTAGMLAASRSADVIELFVKAAGRFTEEKDREFRTAAFYVVDDVNPESLGSYLRPAAIEAFAKAGASLERGASATR